MPIYEYECRRCAHRFELIQKFSDKPRKRCPECRGGVDRLISPAAIRFKGTGWYVTDYADKKKPPEAERAEAEASADSKKTDSKKTDSKKTESKQGNKAS
jgi:putative FmdB family regulatory protein